MKHAGQLVSKARYLAAPWIGMLESGAWIARAAHANAMAAQARRADAVPDPAPGRSERRLRRDGRADPAAPARVLGWLVYRFLDGSVRFMCSWATTEEAVEALAASLQEVA